MVGRSGTDMYTKAAMPRLALVACLAVAAALAQQPPTAGVELFEKKIRPLLSEQCSTCHVAKLSSGGLRLESRDATRKGGGRGLAVAPGHAEASLLLRATSYTEATLRMPPSGKLTEQQIADLKEWVQMGAP